MEVSYQLICAQVEEVLIVFILLVLKLLWVVQKMK